MGLGAIGEMGARRCFRKLDKNHNGKLDTIEAVNAVGMIQAMLGSGNKWNTKISIILNKEHLI